ncbi:sulfurtransferase [Sutcliffiella horikoshii]|uniref:Sulfurtransferase n=1 Tax=Sutcliffiella horikoshii TaxID=79883 RepID=A0A5D4SYK5_9BACI|nr:sulfurtransferase [Sutcliffiella horikoshii]TYS68463.1 sulfurtransferase [Sutcliffiella horikoshii]
MNHIVSADWVKEHINEITVIDCRFHLAVPDKGLIEYHENHIPGAHYMDLNKDLSNKVDTHGGRHPLPDFQELHRKLQNIGVHDGGKVLLYDDQNGAMASRLWFLLKILGHEHVLILDGGYREWLKQEYPVTPEVPLQEKRDTFTFKVIEEEFVMHMEEVKSQLSTFQSGAAYLLDAREPNRYRGLEEPIDKVAGHIPGALNFFWMENMENGKWKKTEALQERFSQLDPSKEIVVYCGSGVTACPTFFALKEAGYEKVKVYAGSWSDWISYTDNPISKIKN